MAEGKEKGDGHPPNSSTKTYVFEAYVGFFSRQN
jgi:hypothetical protein